MALERIKSEEGSVEGFLLLIPLSLIASICLATLFLIFQSIILVSEISSATRVIALDTGQFEPQIERLKKQSSKIGIKVESILLNNVSGSEGVKSLNVEIKSNLLTGLPGISRYARRSISVPFISES